MKQVPDRANDRGTRGQQMYLLPPPPFSPTYPNRSSLAGEALAIPTDTTALDERLAQEKATSPGDSFL